MFANFNRDVHLKAMQKLSLLTYRFQCEALLIFYYLTTFSMFTKLLLLKHIKEDKRIETVFMVLSRFPAKTSHKEVNKQN